MRVQEILARLPRVDHVLDLLADHPAQRPLQKKCVQALLNDVRTSVRGGKHALVTSEQVADLARARLDTYLAASPTLVINATGVVLHTNLGRAPLSEPAIAAMCAAAGYCDLEVDVATGVRSSRLRNLQWLASGLCGAEDVLVVNNGAAAILLVCTSLAGNAGVALSRGQMVEIGDRFRVAEMVAAAGTGVIAVGSTNRTHLRDYQRACEAGAAAVLWVHRSNFVQQGFVGEPSVAELKKVAHANKVPLIADLGSGCLASRTCFDNEPTVAEVLAAGADIVTCSGDKLLGGPQAGIIAGSAALVARCRQHPMARALRVDKVTLAALHATLSLHATTPNNLLLHQVCEQPTSALQARAQAIAEALGWPATAVVEVQDTLGGGSLPGQQLPGAGLCVPHKLGKPSDVARRLRGGSVPIFARVHQERVWLHLRTVPSTADGELTTALKNLHVQIRPG